MPITDSLLKRGAAIAVAGSVLLAACTPAQTGSSGSGGPSVAPAQNRPGTPANAADLAKLRGDVVIDGSSTVFPVTSAAAEEFRRFAKDVRITVGVSGTGGGFKRFCAGETAMQNASRPISPSEIEACQKAGVDFIELPVAYDGLAVLVSPRNTFVECLTVAELKTMWEPAAQGKVTNWNQIRSSFPNQPLKLFGPGADSGTFDYFTEAVMGKAKDSRGDFQASEDDNVLVQGISNDPNAVGYFGFAYYVENQSKLKLVGVDKGNGTCVKPSIETVNNASYQPLSRPLFIYIRKQDAARPEVKGFVEYYLSKAFTPVIESKEVGYVKLPDKFYDAALKRFQQGTLGTLWPKGAEVGATLDRYIQ